MTPAKTIKFTLPEGVTPEPKEKVRPFTRLDNEYDLTLLMGLTASLIKPALFLISRRNLRDTFVTWSEVSESTGMGRSQVFAALKSLHNLDLVTCTEGRWAWSGVRKTGLDNHTLSPENRTETFGIPDSGVRKTGLNTPENTVPVKEKQVSERRGKKEMKNNNSTDARDAYREAVRVVDDAGLLPLWGQWVGLGRLTRVTQESQIKSWALWITDGKAAALRAEAQNIIELGSFAHPFAALRKKLDLPPLNTNTPATTEPSSAGRPALRVGTRVRYPDGTEATIVAVLARGVATDHPENPDVPLGRVRTLEVVS